MKESKILKVLEKIPSGTKLYSTAKDPEEK